MSYDLCWLKPARKPYFIDSIGMEIYSIEELCFYFYENIYLIDETIINEALCDWLRDELGLARLYRVLYEQLERQEGVSGIIISIFREAGYLSAAQLRSFQEKLGKLDVQPGDTRQKMKADYLVKCGMYGNAVREYCQILDRRGPGNLGGQFYSEIWNNLGCAYAGMFQFRDASECFFKAWEHSKTKEMMRKYVSTLPLFLEPEEYRKKLEQLGADSYLIAKIQEYNSDLCQNIAGNGDLLEEHRDDMEEYIEELKADYRRSLKC